MQLLNLLQQVQAGEVSPEDAQEMLKSLPYEDLGFAKLDHHRKVRSGFGEVIYCAGKSDEHLVSIYQTFAKEDTPVMGTRASKEQAQVVQAAVPQAIYDPVSRILRLGEHENQPVGKVAVCTAGTSDIAVAEEAAQTAEFLGANVERFYDVGVAGIHRLFARLPDIQSANCIGALAGVLAGLVDKPIIALPTSVGYGANFHGLSALLTMLNSCAEGIAVVNIDNGFGAGYLAAQINRLVCKNND